MGIRSRGLATAVAALLLVSLPVYAQDGSNTVAFDGIGFTFDEALGASVNITQVPAEPPMPDTPLFASPHHLAFTVYGPRSEGAKVPRANSAPGVVRFYPTADLADYAWPSQQLADLQSLVDARPDLAAYTAADDVEGAQSLPFVLDGSSGQAIHARAHYVDTPDLAGVAFLTVFRQDVYPFAAGDFWYTFQGLSTDGSWYVAADFAIEAGAFPAKVSQKQAKRTSTVGKWLEYQERSLETLDEAAPGAFTPPLTSIDALVESITFGSGSAT
jgi:hypothetical protein